ncbi:heme oxygenase 1 [Nilaparvata lugens]|uniref:heme oxygenase 1 n=1 Tax=Nilaparvata lugens TaxID=108931 RepID=UPI00193C9799|nr:heme oxygenase 1 [Nilaparvata lugens]
MASEVPFNKQLRKATRDVHAMSDALVNAKLAFAMSDNSVWAEGLLVFYEIFRYLELAMHRLRDTPVGELHIEGMARSEAFERDLDFYLGANWRQNYKPRDSVANYLAHLQRIEREDPIRLCAYVYHLYMGLFSGGQILRKKRNVTKKFRSFAYFLYSNDVTTEAKRKGGDAVTDFGDNSVYELKLKLVKSMNSIAANMDEKTRMALIEESKTVFLLNNSLVKTVRGADEVLLRRLIVFAIVIVILMILFFVFIAKE